MKSGSHPSDLTQQENRGAVSKKWQQFILILTIDCKAPSQDTIRQFCLSQLPTVCSEQSISGISENRLSLQKRQLVSISSLQSVDVFDNN